VFLQNVGIQPEHYMTQQARRPPSIKQSAQLPYSMYWTRLTSQEIWCWKLMTYKIFRMGRTEIKLLLLQKGDLEHVHISWCKNRSKLVSLVSDSKNRSKLVSLVSVSKNRSKLVSLVSGSNVFCYNKIIIVQPIWPTSG
jgi:hypothetical protein